MIDNEFAEREALEGCRLLNLAKVCAATGLSRRNLEAVMRDPREGFPPRVAVRRRHYVRLSDLRAWLDRKATAGATP